MASYTIGQARDAIISHFESAWSGFSYDLDDIKYENKPEDRPDGDDVVWCRFRIEHTFFKKNSLSNPAGLAKYGRDAILTIQLFAPCNDGLNDEIPQSIVDIFEAGVATLPGIWFRDTTAKEIGTDGIWYQTNITANVQYDQIK